MKKLLLYPYFILFSLVVTGQVTTTINDFDAPLQYFSGPQNQGSNFTITSSITEGKFNDLFGPGYMQSQFSKDGRLVGKYVKNKNDQPQGDYIIYHFPQGFKLSDLPSFQLDLMTEGDKGNVIGTTIPIRIAFYDFYDENGDQTSGLQRKGHVRNDITLATPGIWQTINLSQFLVNYSDDTPGLDWSKIDAIQIHIDTHHSRSSLSNLSSPDPENRTYYLDNLTLTTTTNPFSNDCDLLVTNTNNSGTGSLRSAINCANSNIDESTITFNIPESNGETINLITQLPSITTPVIIDASDGMYTTSFETTGIKPSGIILDGNNKSVSIGFDISGSGKLSVIGLRIKNFHNGFNATNNNSNSVVSCEISFCTKAINLTGASQVFAIKTSNIHDNTYGLYAYNYYGDILSQINNYSANTYGIFGSNIQDLALSGDQIHDNVTYGLQVTNLNDIFFNGLSVYENPIAMQINNANQVINGAHPGGDLGLLLSSFYNNRTDGLTVNKASYVDLHLNAFYGNDNWGASLNNISDGQVAGNRIGVTYDQNTQLFNLKGNKSGGMLLNNASSVDVIQNIIGNNYGPGIKIAGNSSSIVFEGNNIGGLHAGTGTNRQYQIFGNAEEGVLIEQGSNCEFTSGNFIAKNGTDGVKVNSGTGNKIVGVDFYGNTELAINIENGSNGGVTAPTNIVYSLNGNLLSISGNSTMTSGNAQVYVSDNSNDQNTYVLLGTIAISNGGFSGTLTTPAEYEKAGYYLVNVSAGSSVNNTSEFNSSKANLACLEVTNTKSYGVGSLRNAIECANTDIDASVITFNIPTSDAGYSSATGEMLIDLSQTGPNGEFYGALPDLTYTVTLDGSTQPNGRIVINQGTTPTSGRGLICSNYSLEEDAHSILIKSIDITNFSTNGILINTSHVTLTDVMTSGSPTGVYCAGVKDISITNCNLNGTYNAFTSTGGATSYSVISNNSSTTGGWAFNQSITNLTFSNNTISNGNLHLSQPVNCVISDNNITYNGVGNAVVVSRGAGTTIESNSISANTLQAGTVALSIYHNGSGTNYDLDNDGIPLPQGQIKLLNNTLINFTEGIVLSNLAINQPPVITSISFNEITQKYTVSGTHTYEDAAGDLIQLFMSKVGTQDAYEFLGEVTSNDGTWNIEVPKSVIYNSDFIFNSRFSVVATATELDATSELSNVLDTPLEPVTCENLGMTLNHICKGLVSCDGALTEVGLYPYVSNSDASKNVTVQLLKNGAVVETINKEATYDVGPNTYFENIGGGRHAIRLSHDELGCSITSNTFTVQKPSIQISANAEEDEVLPWKTTNVEVTVDAQNTSCVKTYVIASQTVELYKVEGITESLIQSNTELVSTFSNLNAGTYRVKTDVDYTELGICSEEFTFVIGEESFTCEQVGLSISDLCVNPTSCFSGNVGGLNVSLSNQIGQPMNYDITGPNNFNESGTSPNGAIAFAFPNMAGGTYNIEIRDENFGCIQSQTAVISTPNPSVSIEGGNSINVCSEADLTAVTYTITPGIASDICNVGSFTNIVNILKWDGSEYVSYRTESTNQLTGTIVDLPIGEYKLDVIFGEGTYHCPTSTTFELTPSMFVDVVKTNVKCFGNETGTARVDITGATYPKIYWKAGNTTFAEDVDVVRALEANGDDFEYSVVVESQFCDDVIIPFDITEPEELQLAFDNNYNDCHLTAEITGGTLNYTVRWSNDGEKVYSETSTDGLSDPKSNGAVMSPGMYTVRVKDANGCILVSEEEELLQPEFERTIEWAMVWKPQNMAEEHPELEPEINVAELQLKEMKAKAMDVISEEKHECLTAMKQDFSEVYRQNCMTAESIEDRLTMNYDVDYYHYTLYYYDRSGNLMKTISPEGVKDAIVSSRTTDPTHTFETTYKYNSLGQLVSQNTPDGGVTNFIYNENSQLLFSQNAEQLTRGAYSYSKYDELGRVIEVGQSTEGTFANFTNEGDLPSNVSLISEATKTYYSIVSLSVTYFGESQEYLDNRVSRTEVINKNGEVVKSYYSYDPHGNVTWVINDVPGIGLQYVRYEYDLISGNVNKVFINEKQPNKFFMRYDFDEDNRIIASWTSKDDIIWERDAKYDYYEHGSLKRTEIGRDKIQGIDYVYTIQGWLKGINAPVLTESNDPGNDGSNEFASDEFGMTLGYYNGDFVKGGSVYDSQNVLTLTASNNLYNGNISSWVSRTQEEYQQQKSNDEDYDRFTGGYTYTYDKVNRLKESNYNTFNGSTYVSSSNYHSSYVYDANGNIENLTRTGDSAVKYDDLSYHYTTGQNQLEWVNDEADDNVLNVDIDKQAAGNYVYDALGNLIEDKAEGLKMSWTVYGKLAKVEPLDNTFDKPKMEFVYDAGGNRVKKTVDRNPFDNDLSDVTVTYYIKDAAGKTVAVTEADVDAHPTKAGEYLANFSLKEVPIYGSDRLGVYTAELALAQKEFTTITELNDLNPELLIDGVQKENTELPSTQTIVKKSSTLTANSNDVEMETYRVATVDAVNGVNYSALTMGDATAKIVAHDALGNIVLSGIYNSNYWGNEDVFMLYDDLGLVIDKSQDMNVVKGSQPVVVNNPQNKEEYIVVSTGNDEKLYYHVYNSSNKTLSINHPLSSDALNYGLNLTAVEDQALVKSFIYASREGASETEVVRFEITVNGLGANSGKLVGASNSDYKNVKLKFDSKADKLAVAYPKDGYGMLPFENYDVVEYGINNVYRPEATIRTTTTKAVSSNISMEYTADNNLWVNEPRMAETADPGGNPHFTITNEYGRAVAYVHFGAEGALQRTNKGEVNINVIDAISTEGIKVDKSSGLDLNFNDQLEGNWAEQHYVSLSSDIHEQIVVRTVGNKHYELKDHLGNVRVVVTDQKKAVVEEGELLSSADVISYTNYMPFGMEAPGRTFSTDEYRYGFNGMQKDDELKGSGNSLDFGDRMYDPRLGRWIKPDLLEAEAPMWTPYRFAFDNPIRFLDPTGQFEIDATTAAKYKKLTAYLKNIATEYAEKPAEFKKAFKEYSELSDEQIKQMLTFGEGPKIEVKDLDKYTWFFWIDKEVNGGTIVFKNKKTGVLKNRNDGKGLIRLDDDVVNKLEKATTDDGKEAGKILVESTLFHECTHFGDVKKDGKSETIETGKEFEKKAYGKDIGRGNVDKFVSDKKADGHDVSSK